MNIIINKKINILKLAREFLVVLFIIWSLNPMANFYSRYIGFGILLIWLVFAFLLRPNVFFVSINKGFLLAFAFPLFSAFSSLVSRNEINATYFMMTFIYFIFWYYYNLKDYTSMKIISFSAVVYYVIIAVYSISRLAVDGRLARYLAQSDQSRTILYAHPLLANYTYIYSLILLAVTISGILFIYSNSIKRTKKLYLFLCMLSFLIVVIMAQFMIAILLFATFLVIMLNITRKRTYRNIIIQLLFLILLIFIFLNIDTILIFFSRLSTSQTLKTRLNDIRFLIKGFDISATEALSLRFKLYLDSINTFFSYPFFGVGYTEYRMGGLVGGHSEILDRLAYHGIIGAGFLFTGVYSNYKYIINKMNDKSKKIYKTIFIMFIFVSLLNLSYSIPFLIMLYIIIPFGIIVYEQYHVNDRI